MWWDYGLWRGGVWLGVVDLVLLGFYDLCGVIRKFRILVCFEDKDISREGYFVIVGLWGGFVGFFGLL